MKRFILILLGLVCSSAQADELLPPKGRVIVFQDGDNGSPAYTQFKRVVGNEPSGFVTWVGGDWNDYNTFLVRGFLCECKTKTAALLNIQIQDNQADDFANGKFDYKLGDIARSIKECGRPVFLLMYGEGKKTPAQYVAICRHMHDLMKKEDAHPAIVFDAASTVFRDADRPNAAYYPGDQYVDWFSVQVYHRWQIDLARRIALNARNHGKHLMIVETGPLASEPKCAMIGRHGMSLIFA